jgi:hypothetical protein
MYKAKNDEVWIFLSHSNMDYDKVRIVRNILEEQGLRPLMFFLHCLSDDDEIDTLIKREIDCRTRFILCDSENARKSKWVQKEVAYIKSQNRIVEAIDMTKGIEEIAEDLKDFIAATKIFISYNKEEYDLAEKVYERLSKYDFTVYIDAFWKPGAEYNQNYIDTINFLKEAASGGFVVSIMNHRIMNHNSTSRYELIRAIKENRSTRNGTPNVIPFSVNEHLIKAVYADEKLSELEQCGIENIDGLDIRQQCDAIVKRVVTTLMTPGAIKVQAANFMAGVNCKVDEAEARFLLNNCL